MWLFLTIELVIKTLKAKENFTGNRGDNILRHFDVWQNFPFTTSETKRDYY